MLERQRQQAALRYIIGYQEAKGYSPSVREIARGLGGNSNAYAHEALTDLADGGWIRRLPCRARAIEVLRPISIAHGLYGEPLFFLPVKHG